VDDAGTLGLGFLASSEAAMPFLSTLPVGATCEVDNDVPIDGLPPILSGVGAFADMPLH
jgi:hypothetical protein